MRLSIRAFSLALLLAPAGALAKDPLPAAPKAAPAATRVGAVIASKEPVTQAQEFVGRVEAMERVNVRARVTGFLEAVLFKEGDKVKEGAPLYRLEQEPFQAAVQQTQGALMKAEGQAGNATAQRERAESLLKTQSGSAAVRDQRVAEEQTAKGDVVVAKANLDAAKINLHYTEIMAPISGLIGRTSVTKGNVVGPDSGVLTSIVSQDPMYVVAPVSQREFLRLQADERRSVGASVQVNLRFSDGSKYPYPGKINFVDVSVDRATDAVTVRATMPNPDGKLIDGQLVRVTVQGEKPKEKVVIPQAALIADQQGPYVFVVEDGKAVVRRLKLNGESGSNSVVESGLEGGEQVIVEGLEGLRPGAPVLAAPAAPAPGRS
ncbi:efflux RND transporter periplasmic adaptor subunit [Methylocapsa aurea]|uniref:efflux RND transporter periplasmic adaptor subunit n=1 Tax=Methylocapsa aurea TaxID=663610 RepID=UPI00056AFC3C|nr:efflux RND transporter periplasmic adaptor subunit [Methylocapsa aurea]